MKSNGGMVKKILYFILAVITIGYVGILCYANLAPVIPEWVGYIKIYGGLCIALAYAAINFFGSPLKTVFFILLILSVVFLVLTIFIPDMIRDLLGIVI